MLLTSPVVLTLILTPIVYIIYHVTSYVVGIWRQKKAFKQYATDPTHWLWGHLHVFPEDEHQQYEYDINIARRFPKCSGFHIGPVYPILQVRHPDTVKVLLKSKEPKPISDGTYGFGLPWIGEGLLTSSGKKWARNRRLLTPAFHFDVLKPYIDVYNACADILLDKLATHVKSGDSVEIFSAVSLHTFDVILRCAMSYEGDVQAKGETHPYVMAVSRLGLLWIRRFLNPRRLLTVLGGTVLGGNFLDILLKAKDENGRGLTFREIRDEVDTFMFEGHDTTASAISWTLYSLAGHPEIQKRCQEEVDGILEGRDSDYVTWDDLPRLKYLTQCIKEAMRLHNPVPQIARLLTEDTEIDGKVMPKGTTVQVQLHALHHHPDVWQDDLEYRPSRFDPDNENKMDNYAFVPFSAGPRNCIGQHFAMHEMKTTVARILRRYTIVVDPGAAVRKRIAVVMRSQHGIMLEVSPR